MARMSIDDSVSRDPRITVLAAILGWTRRETVGCLVMEVWPICYDQRTHLLAERIIDAAAQHDGFAKAMLEAELATRDRSGKLSITGAKERIEYLNHKAKAGRQGGLNSAESRRKASKQTSSTGGSTAQARGNPPVPDSSPVSAPVPVPPPVQEKREEMSSAAPTASTSKVRKQPEYTESELASVRTVLDRLSDRSGVKYQGSKEHTRLIVARLRDGCSEWDLRRVIGYCAERLAWEADPKMRTYLRPETLFGPQTIAKYLDAARAWAPHEPPTPSGGASSNALHIVDELAHPRWKEPPWMS